MYIVTGVDTHYLHLCFSFSFSRSPAEKRNKRRRRKKVSIDSRALDIYIMGNYVDAGDGLKEAKEFETFPSVGREFGCKKKEKNFPFPLLVTAEKRKKK